ncbi:hypothetical protein FB45DRAFT_924652 [Roridomyces roridus]|uniref:Mitochondrial chaperone BCS1-like ATPase lid domain-containing protein n=1 Tax=Roridomyces roridus TaxID=1738132 RepID=A0AAD7BJQ1_9AGAR|nr:hypothetical protein FB45DRAFT_924652 [Roridomyces roridus]
MDIHLEFKLASKYQAEKLFSSFYLPTEEEKKGEKDSGAAVDDAEEGEEPTFFGTTHRKQAPKLGKKQVAKLAARFAENVPEREVSMAALQGYLMTYKVRPYEAVNAVKDWVESEREAQLKKVQAAAADSQTAPSTEEVKVDL